MTTNGDPPAESATQPREPLIVETEALKALRFYTDRYETLFFRGVGGANKQIMLGTKPNKCRFCDGERPARTFKKRAHAVSELLGNKAVKSLHECDVCNERFAAFEDDLAKMTLPYRHAGAVIGKNGVPTIVSASGKARIEFKNGQMHIAHSAHDESFVVDEENRTITFAYVEQPYRPLGAYKALCKSGFALLPAEELANFSELKEWLLHEDVATRKVYSDGNHVYLQSFVPAFRPFPQAIVALLRRKETITAPYMTLFIAFGNVSYQIFLPCPANDGHLVGQKIQVVRYPHLYQLQPWRAQAEIIYGHRDLSSSARTIVQTRKMGWHFDRQEKVARAGEAEAAARAPKA
jgi:hypothetical protein